MILTLARQPNWVDSCFTSLKEIAGVATIRKTVADFTLTVNGVTLDGHKLDECFPKVNWKKFTQRNLHRQLSWKSTSCGIGMLCDQKLKKRVDTPVRFYIPVFPGTNSEYDCKAKRKCKVTWYHLSHWMKKLLSSLLTLWLTISKS